MWLGFSGGGVAAAIFLPMLVLLCAFAFPFGWVEPPSYDDLRAAFEHPLTRLVLLGLFAAILVHAAHRFRFTLYDGLQIKARFLVATACYGAALIMMIFALDVLTT